MADLILTEKQVQYVNKYWGEDHFTDEIAKEIVVEFIGKEINEIEYAFWVDDDCKIAYKLTENEEEDEEDVAPGWTSEYLATLGMSFRDFM